MKKIIALLLALCMMAVLFVGCGGGGDDGDDASNNSPSADVDDTNSPSPDDGEEETPADEPRKFGFSCDNLNTDFAAGLSAGFQAACNELGYEYIICDSQTDNALQASQVENMITDGCDAIVFKPFDVSGSGASSAACEEAGVPMVVVASAPIESHYDTLVGASDADMGTLKAEYAVEQMGEEFNCVFILGDLGMQQFNDIRAATEEVLAQYPGIQILDAQFPGTSTADAMRLTENWISRGLDIDCIFAYNDQSAIGAGQAWQDSGLDLDDVLIIGQGGMVQGLTALQEGLIDMTVYLTGYNFGYEGVYTADAILNGETFEEEIMCELFAVTADSPRFQELLELETRLAEEFGTEG